MRDPRPRANCHRGRRATHGCFYTLVHRVIGQKQPTDKEALPERADRASKASAPPEQRAEFPTCVGTPKSEATETSIT